MVIMTGGIVMVANAWSGNFMRMRKARINATFATLLQTKMTEYEVKYAERPLEVPEEEAGDFGPKYPGFRWEMKSKEFEMPDLSGVAASKEGGANEIILLIMKTAAEYAKKSVKEVAIKVYFKPRAGPEVSNQVSSYFIDYSKEVEIPGGLPAGAMAPGGGK
jgi:hypothetical protein